MKKERDHRALLLTGMLLAHPAWAQNCTCSATTLGAAPQGSTADWAITNQVFQVVSTMDGRCNHPVCDPPPPSPCSHTFKFGFDVVLLTAPPVPPVVNVELDVDGTKVDIVLPPTGLQGNVLSYLYVPTVEQDCDIGHTVTANLDFYTNGIHDFRSGWVAMTCGGC